MKVGKVYLVLVVLAMAASAVPPAQAVNVSNTGILFSVSPEVIESEVIREYCAAPSCIVDSTAIPVFPGTLRLEVKSPSVSIGQNCVGGTCTPPVSRPPITIFDSTFPSFVIGSAHSQSVPVLDGRVSFGETKEPTPIGYLKQVAGTNAASVTVETVRIDVTISVFADGERTDRTIPLRFERVSDFGLPKIEEPPCQVGCGGFGGVGDQQEGSDCIDRLLCYYIAIDG